MIGVARPTRGIEFSESSQSIERNLSGLPYLIERSWDKAIPHSFNYCVDLLLSIPEITHIWFVEEDVVVPPGSFHLLYKLNTDIAALDYPLKKQDGAPSEFRDKNGKLVWVSLGCTLVKRKVFEVVESPWFRSQYTTGYVHEGSSCKEKRLVLKKTDHPYGGHDVYFCWMAIAAGFKLASVKRPRAEHLEIEAWGAPDNNDGCHKIRRIKPKGEDSWKTDSIMN